MEWFGTGAAVSKRQYKTPFDVLNPKEGDSSSNCRSLAGSWMSTGVHEGMNHQTCCTVLAGCFYHFLFSCLYSRSFGLVAAVEALHLALLFAWNLIGCRLATCTQARKHLLSLDTSLILLRTRDSNPFSIRHVTFGFHSQSMNLSIALSLGHQLVVKSGPLNVAPGRTISINWTLTEQDERHSIEASLAATLLQATIYKLSRQFQ